MDTLESAGRKLDAVSRDLSNDEATAQAFAELVADRAGRRAASRPTPQAPGVGRSLMAWGGHVKTSLTVILSGRPVAASGVGWGSEFGSSLYTQFGPRHARGAWLYPTANDPALGDEFEATYIADVIEDHV